MSECIPCLSFWVCLSSFGMVLSSSFRWPSDFMTSLFFVCWFYFYSWIIPHCGNVPHFLSPLIFLQKVNYDAWWHFNSILGQVKMRHEHSYQWSGNFFCKVQVLRIWESLHHLLGKEMKHMTHYSVYLATWGNRLPPENREKMQMQRAGSYSQLLCAVPLSMLSKFSLISPEVIWAVPFYLQNALFLNFSYLQWKAKFR